MIEIIPLSFFVPTSCGLEFLAEKLSKFVRDRDVVVVASKAVSYCEGRLVNLKRVGVSAEAVKLAKKYEMPPEVAEVVLREADKILGGVKGFLLTLKFGMLCPNAGVDLSNAPPGYAVVYPENPDASAEMLRELLNRRVGVVISDSRLFPLRAGVSSIAIACSGIEGVEDLRGRKDIYGKELKRTFRNVADMLANAAALVMGEGGETIPAAIVRNADVRFCDGSCSLSINPKECIYSQILQIKEGKNGRNKDKK